MEENIYKSPESEINVNSNNEPELATRGRRLWASMIDGFTIAIVTIPAMYFTGGFDGISEGVKPAFTYTLLFGLLGIVIFFMINLNSLKATGQTLGKKVAGIKVVTQDGELPTLRKHFLKRYSVYFVPGQIPVVGQILSTLNILFIFGKNKRCVHDIAAGTKVVAC